LGYAAFSPAVILCLRDFIGLTLDKPMHQFVRPTTNRQNSLIPQTLRCPAAYLLAPGSECKSYPLDYIGASRPDRCSDHRVRLRPLAVYHVQVAIPRRGSAAASWPAVRRPDCGRCRKRVQGVDVADCTLASPTPIIFSSSRQKHQRPPRPNSTEEGVKLDRTPTNSREVAEVPPSHRTHRIHLCGGQHVTGPSGSQPLISKLPKVQVTTTNLHQHRDAWRVSIRMVGRSNRNTPEVPDFSATRARRGRAPQRSACRASAGLRPPAAVCVSPAAAPT